GYLLVWAYAGLVVYALVQTGLQTSKDLAHHVPWLDNVAWAPLVLAATLALAGLYQFTPLKQRCLRHCRSPSAFVRLYWRGRNGNYARPLPSRLLLGPLQCDGCCCRDDEHRLDGCDDTGGIRRKGVAARSKYFYRGGGGVGRSRAAGRKWHRPARRLMMPRDR